MGKVLVIVLVLLSITLEENAPWVAMCTQSTTGKKCRAISGVKVPANHWRQLHHLCAWIHQQGRSAIVTVVASLLWQCQSCATVGFNYLRMPLPFSLSSLCTSLIRPKNILLRPRLHPLPFSSIASRGSRTISKAVTAALPFIHTQAEMMCTTLLPSAENKSEVWVGGEESRRRLVKVVGCYLCQLGGLQTDCTNITSASVTVFKNRPHALQLEFWCVAFQLNPK